MLSMVTLQGGRKVLYAPRELNAWPATKKAPSPDVFAAAGQRMDGKLRLISLYTVSYH
jgi:hypothetical protein